MGLDSKHLFFAIFLSITIAFSWFAYQPEEVVIAGPYFPEIDYFLEELDEISKKNKIKIKYLPLSDVETHLIETIDHEIDLALIPNPQGVVNLGQRGIAYPLSGVISVDELRSKYSQHLIDITTSKKNNLNYGAWFRLIPNSLIWYDVEKFKDLDSPTFNSYEDLVLFTREFSSNGDALWCLDIESGASTGWIATNWLEDLILHQQGPEVYDKWASQELLSSSDEITLSILDIGKLIFIDNAVYGGNERIIRKEFRKDSKVVFNSLISDNFGKIWMTKKDASYIPANKNASLEVIKNNQTKKEASLVKEAVENNLFRYDASELMERRIGSDSLWYAMKKYIDLTSEYIDEVTEELDFSY